MHLHEVGRMKGAVLFACVCTAAAKDAVSLVTAAEVVLGSASELGSSARDERFTVAADGTQLESHGAYGEFPLRGIATILSHDAVQKRIMSSMSASFVDVGSGAGRLLLAVAAMRADLWSTVTGIEASESLHAIATHSIKQVERAQLLAGGVVGSLHADFADDAASDVLRKADVIFCYSTALPTPDGLRLPRLSAALTAAAPVGSLVITTDKWLVGDRFSFEALITIPGGEDDGTAEDGGMGDEQINAFLWRVVGQPPRGGQAVALADIEARWMGDDACADQPGACEALVRALGLEDDADEDS